MSQEDIESEKITEVERCSACYDELNEENKVVLECPHALCKWCYEPCITEAARCPVCRHPIKIIPKNDSLNIIEWKAPTLPTFMEPIHIQLIHDLRKFDEEYQVYAKEYKFLETRLSHAMELNSKGYDVSQSNFVVPKAPTINRVIYIGQDTYIDTNYIKKYKSHLIHFDENTIQHTLSDAMIPKGIHQNDTLHYIKRSDITNHDIITVSKVTFTGEIMKLNDIYMLSIYMNLQVNDGFVISMFYGIGRHALKYMMLQQQN
jgi:azurin